MTHAVDRACVEAKESMMQIDTKVERLATPEERETADRIADLCFRWLKAGGRTYQLSGGDVSVWLNFSSVDGHFEIRNDFYQFALNTLRARPLETQQDKPANETRATTDAIPEGARTLMDRWDKIDPIENACVDGLLATTNALQMQNVRLRNQVARLTEELANAKKGAE